MVRKTHWLLASGLPYCGTRIYVLGITMLLRWSLGHRLPNTHWIHSYLFCCIHWLRWLHLLCASLQQYSDHWFPGDAHNLLTKVFFKHNCRWDARFLYYFFVMGDGSSWMMFNEKNLLLMLFRLLWKQNNDSSRQHLYWVLFYLLH